MGNIIEVLDKEPRIVSLYRDHTENLFHFGAGELLVGIDQKSLYPPATVKLPRYDLSKQYDLEAIIEAAPDYVLVAPSVNSKYRGGVSRLEGAGITVVSILPEDFEGFDDYLRELGMLSHSEDVAEESIKGLHRELEAIADRTNNFKPKTKVFFEASENGYQAISPGTLPYLALGLAGADNLASGVEPEFYNSLYSPFGLENILAIGDEIEVYLTLQGGTKPGSSPNEIIENAFFQDVSAIQMGRVYELDQVRINGYTLRYPDAVYDLARMLYPDELDDYQAYVSEETLTRRKLASIVVKFFHLPDSVISKAGYYDWEKFHHSYGSFSDVDWHDPDFQDIETAVMHYMIQGMDHESGFEYYSPDEMATRADLAYLVYMSEDLEMTDFVETLDIAGRKDEKIIQTVIDSGRMEISDGYFLPDETLSCREFIEYLEEWYGDADD
jgi:iron complex transport system substrate-binding protein